MVLRYIVSDLMHAGTEMMRIEDERLRLTTMILL